MAYVECKHSRTVGLQYLSCYVALMLGLLLQSYIIMTMRVFIRNVAGDSGHLQCTDTFAWSRGCPFMTGRGKSLTRTPLRISVDIVKNIVEKHGCFVLVVN